MFKPKQYSLIVSYSFDLLDLYKKIKKFWILIILLAKKVNS